MFVPPLYFDVAPAQPHILQRNVVIVGHVTGREQDGTHGHEADEHIDLHGTEVGTPGILGARLPADQSFIEPGMGSTLSQDAMHQATPQSRIVTWSFPQRDAERHALQVLKVRSRTFFRS
jgi:hypothetical protein